MAEEEIEKYNHIHRITNRGEIVKSVGELLITNYFFERKIDYLYERRLKLNTVDSILKSIKY